MKIQGIVHGAPVEEIHRELLVVVEASPRNTHAASHDSVPNTKVSNRKTQFFGKQAARRHPPQRPTQNDGRRPGRRGVNFQTEMQSDTSFTWDTSSPNVVRFTPK